MAKKLVRTTDGRVVEIEEGSFIEDNAGAIGGALAGAVVSDGGVAETIIGGVVGGLLFDD